MASPLEIADRVRDYLPAFAVEEAIQAREREDALCPLCKRLVTAVTDGSLLVTRIGPVYRIALLHRACGASQIVDLDPRAGKLAPDTFALRWRAMVRETGPRAVFLWENQTNFDSWPEAEGGSEAGALRIFGFVPVEDPIDAISARKASYIDAVHHREGLELRLGGAQDRRFPGRQPDVWCAAAEQDGSVLLVYGTALGLDRYDPEHMGQRIASGKVVAAVVPFQSGGHCAGAHLPSHGLRRRVRRGQRH